MYEKRNQKSTSNSLRSFVTADKMNNMHLAYVVMAVQILVYYSYMERVNCRLIYLFISSSHYFSHDVFVM